MSPSPASFEKWLGWEAFAEVRLGVVSPILGQGSGGMVRKVRSGDRGMNRAVGGRAKSCGDSSDLLDVFLLSQTRAIRWQLALALLFVLLGVAMILIGGVPQQPIDSGFPNSALLSLGGVFASTLTAFPIKDLIVRREKADALRALKARMERVELNGGDRREAARIDAALWTVLQGVMER